MKSNIKISVIVPVYTVDRGFLRECIDSILKQTFTEFELILVDDGAPKENADLLDEYAISDNRVRVIHKQNEGASVARNAGLDAAVGEYVTFVDSDDYIALDNLMEAYNAVKEGKLTLLLWGSYKCYDDKKVEYMPFVDDIPLFDNKKKEWLMLKTMAGTLPFYGYPCSKYGSGSCCSKLYLRSFLNENNLRYPAYIKRAEDVNFNIRVFDKADRIGYLNKHFYYYRQLSSSATFKYRDGGIQVFTDALNCLKSFLEETKKPDLFWQVFYMRCMFFILESMDMDYLNKENKKPYFVRMKEMKQALLSEPYHTAISELRTEHLSFAKRIPLFLMKAGWVHVLAAFYTLYRKLM